MSNKRLLLFLVLISIVLNFIGCIQPDSNTKIKETSMKYLKDKYNEDFEFKDVDASWNEGNDWVYSVHAISKSNPTFTVWVKSGRELSKISDNYKEQKWDAVRGEQMKDLIETKFGRTSNFRVRFHVNKEIEDKYPLYTDPVDIIKKEANFKKGSLDGNYQSISENVIVNIPIDENIDEDEVAEKLLDLVKYYNDLNLYFDMKLTFGKREINSDGTFKDTLAEVVVYSNTILEKNNIKKCIKYSK